MLLKRLAVAVTAMAAVFAFTPPAAQAAQTSSNCHTYGRGLLSDGDVCASVHWWYQTDGVGIVIDEIRLYIRNGQAFETDPAVVGYNLTLENVKSLQNVWQKSACSVYQPANEHVYSMGTDNLHLEGEHFTLEWDFKVRLNNYNDADNQALLVGVG